jgi:hypothetical protein
VSAAPWGSRRDAPLVSEILTEPASGGVQLMRLCFSRYGSSGRGGANKLKSGAFPAAVPPALNPGAHGWPRVHLPRSESEQPADDRSGG